MYTKSDGKKQKPTHIIGLLNGGFSFPVIAVAAPGYGSLKLLQNKSKQGPQVILVAY